MSITIYLQDFAKACADVFESAGAQKATIRLYDEQGNYVTVYVPGRYEYRVQAVQAAFEVVEKMRAAVLLAGDVVMKEDMEASIEEKRLIEGGTEALPEGPVTLTPMFHCTGCNDKVYDFSVEDNPAGGKRHWNLDIGPLGDWCGPVDMGGPDGPVLAERDLDIYGSADPSTLEEAIEDVIQPRARSYDAAKDAAREVMDLLCQRGVVEDHAEEDAG